MKKILISVLLVLLGAIEARGQGVLYQLSPPAPNAQVLVCPSPDNGYPCPAPVAIYSNVGLTTSVPQPVTLGSGGFFSFYIAAGTYTIQLLGPGYNSGNRQVVSIGGGSAGSGVTVVASLPGTCTPGAQYQITGTTQFYLCGPGNTYSSINNSTSQNVVYESDYVPQSALGKYATDAAFTNGSGLVTLTANDPVPTAADIGSPCFGTNWNGTNANYSASLVEMTQGTVSAINAGTPSVTCSTTWGTTSGSGTFGWGGSDQTTNFQAAVNAAFNTYPCKSLNLMGGVTWVIAGAGNSSTCTTNNPTTGDKTITVRGQGMRTSIIGLLPNFSFSHATSCTGVVSASNGCFFSLAGGIYMREFSIYGFGNNGTSAPASTSMIAVGTDSYVWDMDIQEIGSSDSNLTGWWLGGGGQIYWNMNENGAGAIGMQVAGSSSQECHGCFFGENKTNAIVVPSSTIYTDYGGGFGFNGASTCGGVGMSVAGTVHLFRTASFETCTLGTLAHIQVVSAGIAYLDHFLAAQTGANETTFLINAGGTGYSINSFLGNPGGTGQPVFIPTSAKYYDEGGNCPGVGTTCGQVNGSQTTGVISPFYTGNQSVNGACTGVGTAASTLGLYGTGANVVATTCTSVVIGTGQVMNRPGNLSQLYVTATAAGTNASSGVVTVLKNGAGTAVTCTIGTGTGCIDVTHSVAFVRGDLISLQFTTQAADTLAGVNAIVGAQ